MFSSEYKVNKIKIKISKFKKLILIARIAILVTANIKYLYIFRVENVVNL